MNEGKQYLNAKEFKDGLLALDREMGQNPWLIAFAPIRIISTGGYFAVTYFKNRSTTEDIDYLMDPEFVKDKDIEGALKEAILSVARQLSYNKKWANDEMDIFVTKKARQSLFEQAIKQGITLFKGENLEILAAPIEWAVETKLRRINAKNKHRKHETDLGDVIIFLKLLRERNNGPLDLETTRTMNTNGFDMTPSHQTMHEVADAYRHKYNEEIFK